MAQSELDTEHVLRLWQRGMSARLIGQRLRHSSGTAYTEDGIRNIVSEARRAGDPRAARRRPGRKAMPPEERARRMRGRILAWLRDHGHAFTPEVGADYIDGLCVIAWEPGEIPVVDYTRKWGEVHGGSERNGEDTRTAT